MLALSLSAITVLAVLLALGLIALFYWSCKSFEGVFALVLFLLCLDAVTVGLPVLSLGKNIQFFDPLAVVVFLAGLARFAFSAKKQIEAPQWHLIALFAVMTVPLSMGFRKYGMAAAPDFRWFFHFMAFALYGSSFDFAKIDVRRLIRYTLYAGAALAALVYFRWAAEAAGLSIAQSWFHVGNGRRFRVVNAAQTYFLAQAALLFLMTRTASGLTPPPVAKPHSGMPPRTHIADLRQRWSVPVAGLGLATSMALMHRSVWTSVLSGIALLAVLQADRRRDFLHMFLASGLLAFILLLPLGLFGYLDTYFAALANNVTEVGEQHSSFADRYVGWQALLGDWARSGDPLAHAIGQPFGTGYYRRLSEFGISIVAEYTPHNFYVQTLLRTGVIGLGIFVSMFVFTGIRTYKTIVVPHTHDDTSMAFRHFLLLSIVMQAVFMLAYGARLEHGLLFGLAMAAASSSTNSMSRRSFLHKV